MPLRLPKMQDHQLLTLHWCSFSGWGRERPSPCLLYKGCQYIRKWQCGTIVNILQLTVGYLNATINWKTRNAEPEIGTIMTSQTWQHPQVHGYGSMFGPRTGCVSGFWTGLEPNEPGIMVQIPTAGGLPRPIANITCKFTLLFLKDTSGSFQWLKFISLILMQMPGIIHSISRTS